MKPVQTTEDIRQLRPGMQVCLKRISCRPFVLTDIEDLRGEGRKVTIVTFDDHGRPHSLVVSAWSLSYEEEVP